MVTSFWSTHPLSLLLFLENPVYKNQPPKEEGAERQKKEADKSRIIRSVICLRNLWTEAWSWMALRQGTPATPVSYKALIY